jgi:opacity protein-like surface antigen
MLLLERLPGLRLIYWMTALSAGLLSCMAHSQAVPSATRPVHALWVGGEYSNISAGFPYESGQRLWGIGGFADYHLTSHIGIEADARFLRFNSFYDETETNYLAGPRYLSERFGRFQPYVQCLTGLGVIQYPFAIGSGNYLVLAPGAGANYRLSRRWALRGEYEYQLWPNSPNIASQPEHEITPSGFHIGIAFKLFQ